MHQLFKPRIIIYCVLFASMLTMPTLIHQPPTADAHVIKYPIILIPGFAGTTLSTSDLGTVYEGDDGHGGIFEHHYLANEQVWINTSEAANPGEDDYFDALKMKPDGQTPESNLYPRFPVPEVYQPTLEYFRTKGYRDGRDLFTFAYDWRRDIRINNDQLDDLITYAKQRTGLPKVNIIAHSMGGLLIRHYITDATKAQNIFRAVTLGTPYLGSPEFLKWMGYGGCLTNLNTGAPCIGIPASETKDIVQNFISGYQLLPSQKYYDFYDGHDAQHPRPFKDTRDIDTNGITGELSYLQVKELLTNTGYNTALFTPAEELHQQIDTTLPVILGGQLTLIVGSGQATIGQIEERNVVNVGNIAINKRDIHMINGDGSVPLFSASLDDSTNGHLLTGNAQVFYTKQNHNQLPQDSNTLGLINHIFTGNPGDTYTNPAITTQPFPLNGWLVSVHSPVTLDLYDENGLLTGTSSTNIETAIPNTYYDTVDDTKYIWVDNISNYYLKFKATSAGSFDLKIREYNNNQIVQAILYKDIPLTQNTIVQSRLNTDNFMIPILQIDADGDGTWESLVDPTETTHEHIDNLPPTTQITVSGEQGNQGWYKDTATIQLAAEDNQGGSGGVKIHYSVNQEPMKQYSTPFQISSEGVSTLTYYSEDQVGNTETLKEQQIKIDRTAPEVQVMFISNQLVTEIVGKDNLTPVSTVKNTDQVVVTDEAGNTTSIKHQAKINKDQTKIELTTISYNGQVFSLTPNRYESTYETQSGTDPLKELEQKISIKGEEKLTAHYSQKKYKTVIKDKNRQDKKQSYEVEGLQTIILGTNKGVVYTSLNI